MMATAAYDAWVRKGRPYSTAAPIAQMVSMARAAGVQILGVIGNEDHLQASTPEDHTPFSATAWPLPLPGYIVTACDLADGPWSDRILALARAGKLPWLKYMNFRGQNYSVKRDWKPVPNSDRHLHLSGRTDFLNASVTVNPFDPEASAPAPAPSKRGDTVGFLARTNADPSVFYGDGFKSHPVQTMAQAGDYEAAGAVWRTYPDQATMFAVIGPPSAATQGDRIEEAVKTPAAVTLTADQLAFLAGTVVDGVLKALSALAARVFGALP